MADELASQTPAESQSPRTVQASAIPPQSSEVGMKEYFAVSAAMRRRAGKTGPTTSGETEILRKKYYEARALGALKSALASQSKQVGFRRAYSWGPKDVEGNPIKAPVGEGGKRRVTAGFSVSRVFDIPYNPYRNRAAVETPTNRKELNARFRYYMRYEPLVAASISLHSEFPLSTFHLTHSDPVLTDEFNGISEDLDLFNFCLKMVREYWGIGECLPFGIADNPSDFKMWKKFMLLNPDYVHLVNHPIAGDDRRDYDVYLEMDETVKTIVSNGPSDPKTGGAFSRLPEDVIRAVRQNIPMKLSGEQVSHFKRSGSNPFDLRGESLLTSILHILAYRDRLRDAQYVAIERHSTPRELYLIGNDNYIPDDEELAAFAELIEGSFLDPNQAIVWHHAVNFQIVGGADKILPLRDEFNHLDLEMMSGLMINKAFLWGEGPCCSSDTEVLTENGWKLMSDVLDGERLCTYNKNTGKAELQNFVHRIVKDHRENMVHFLTDKIDILVTANHRMLVQERKRTVRDRDSFSDWVVKPAVSVKPRSRIPVSAIWDGTIPPETVRVGRRNILLLDYLRLGGWYVTEGHVQRTTSGIPTRTVITQASSSKSISDVEATVSNAGFPFSKYTRHTSGKVRYHGSVLLRNNSDTEIFSIRNREITERMIRDFGCGAREKYVAAWIKNLPRSSLKVLLDTMVRGDGSPRKARSEGKGSELTYHTFITSSNRLADDVQEMAWKCGYAPKCTVRANGIINVYWSESIRHGRHPNLESRSVKDTISSVPYNGKVYCFEVPNEFLITRRSGKIAIIGNTYATSSVALEVLIARYITLRHMVRQWIRDAVFRPLCKVHKIYRVTEAQLKHRIRPSNSDRQLDLPDVQWDKSEMRDNFQRLQLLERLAKDKRFPYELLYQAMNFDSKQVTSMLRKEQQAVLPVPPVVGPRLSLPSPGAPPGGGPPLGGPSGPLEGAPGGPPILGPGSEGEEL